VVKVLPLSPVHTTGSYRYPEELPGRRNATAPLP